MAAMDNPSETAKKLAEEYTDDPGVVAELTPYFQRALDAAAAAAYEHAAQVAESTRGGFTANIRSTVDEPELVRDPDGPWVLNSDIAHAIHALAPKQAGCICGPSALRVGYQFDCPIHGELLSPKQAEQPDHEQMYKDLGAAHRRAEEKR